MSVEVYLLEDVRRFIKTIGSHVIDGGYNYYNIPLWFKEIENGEYEVFRAEDLPSSVKKIIDNDNKLLTNKQI